MLLSSFSVVRVTLINYCGLSSTGQTPRVRRGFPQSQGGLGEGETPPRRRGPAQPASRHRPPHPQSLNIASRSLVVPLPAPHASLSSCLAGNMASRKEGTGSTATSSGSAGGAVGKGKGKGGSGDSAVKQVQIDGLVSAGCGHRPTCEADPCRARFLPPSPGAG